MLRVITTDTILDGIAVDLGAAESVYVASGIKIESTSTTAGANVAIQGTGSGQTVDLHGMAISLGDAVLLGADTTTSHNDLIRIGATGHVASDSGTGVGILGYNATIDNAGYIEAASNGIACWSAGADVASNSSYILNSGYVHGVQNGIYLEAAETVSIRNSGVISGDQFAIASVGSGAVRVVNTGVLNGVVALGEGNDVYNGRDGFAHGNIQGFEGNDRLYGGVSDEIFYGGDGKDVISAGDGEDYLGGGADADKLTGGADADVFQFLDITDSGTDKASRDVITDFRQADGDRLDVSDIDANESKSGINAFKLIDTDGFSGAGQARYEIDGKTTLVFLNTDSDKDAEAAIQLNGKISLTQDDFLLV